MTGIDAREKHYFYDGLGRMSGTRVWVGGTFHFNPNDCQYDAEGRMVAGCQGAPFLSFDGDNVSGTLRTDGKGWTFFHGPGLDSPLMGYFRNTSVGGPARILYWVTDGNGRELAVADSAGVRQSTDDVGDAAKWHQAGGITNSYSFSSGRQDNANMPNLSFFRNRVYDQNTGRWLQEDPLGVAGGLNLYQFNGSNPVAYTDPFGLCPTNAGGDGKTDRYSDCPPGTEGYRRYLESQGQIDKGKRKSKSLGEPMLVRHGTNPTTVTVCMALRKAVKQGAARAIFGLPLFILDGVFNGRLPEVIKGVPIDPRDVQPSAGWDFLAKGMEQAAPAFSLWEENECGKKIVPSD